MPRKDGFMRHQQQVRPATVKGACLERGFNGISISLSIGGFADD
jgi:hypothetical protein